jgi:hypothetical protein
MVELTYVKLKLNVDKLAWGNLSALIGVQLFVHVNVTYDNFDIP